MPVEPHAARASRILDAAGGPPRVQSAILATLPGIKHGFFGREGGVSTGVYTSLNAGRGSSDDAAAIEENRARIAASLGAAPERLITPYQVHSAIALRVEAPWAGPRPEADALVTTARGLALSVLTADCAPVLLADAQAGVIAAAHAGWRGALHGVLEATVAAMLDAGAEARRIQAAVGPTIRQPSYEVGPEFEAEFRAADAEYARFFRVGPSGKSQFDLPGFCAARLGAGGLGRVDVIAIDTYSDQTGFFSHRRSVHQGEADCGRNCAAITLEARG